MGRKFNLKPKGQGIWVKCHHCGHVREYRGDSMYYMGCTKCHYKVHIGKNRLDGQPSESQTTLKQVEKKGERKK